MKYLHILVFVDMSISFCCSTVQKQLKEEAVSAVRSEMAQLTSHMSDLQDVS